MHFDRNRLQTFSETVSAETVLRKIWKKKKKAKPILADIGFLKKTLIVKMSNSNHLKQFCIACHLDFTPHDVHSELCYFFFLTITR